MNHIVTSDTPLYLVFFTILSLFIGCGESEDIETSNPIAHSYDLNETDIYALNIDELLALDVPADWHKTEDPELRSKYFAAQMLQQFGNTPAAQIVAAYERKTKLGISVTFDEAIAHAKARYQLWPNASNRHYLEKLLKIRLREETDDPDLFAKIYREKLIEQHGDIPEVHIVVEGEKKKKFGGWRIATDADKNEYVEYLRAKYVLQPTEYFLCKYNVFKEARDNGTPWGVAIKREKETCFE